VQNIVVSFSFNLHADSQQLSVFI